MQLARKTMHKIDSMVAQDQGSSYRVWLGQVLPHIGDAYRAGNDGHRGHMGASLIGKECARSIWYDFFWATKSAFDGRMVRLFNRGHLEEGRFIALLLMIGCQVWQQDENGNQFRISDVEGHFGGSGDGVALGVPDIDPNTYCLLEFKTHSEKSFKELQAKGVQEAKWEHYVQMNVYMRKMGLAVALYMAVNKNTDEIHAEIVTLNPEVADQYIDRAHKIVWLSEPPKKLSESPGFYKCRFCNHRPVCHLNAKPDKNCRTCTYSRPDSDGKWVCVIDFVEAELSKELQLTGCDRYKQRKM